MTKTICFANNKGGSGKSTTCSNTGYFLAQAGYRTLLVDGDMQLNLSLSFFPQETVLLFASGEKNLYTAVRRGEDLSPCVVTTGIENLDLIPSSTLMSSVEPELYARWDREHVLKKCLANIQESGKYDVILIDAPPTLGCWVTNILAASDYLIIPVEASPWGLFGLSNLFEFLAGTRETAPQLETAGVVITKADSRKNYFKQTVETLGALPVRLFDTVIRLDSTIEWAQDNSKPIGLYKKSARSALEYKNFTDEVIKVCLSEAKA